MSITLLPVPAPRVVHKPYAILAALQVVDVATTWWILNYWSARAEGNPAIAWLLSTTGLSTAMLMLLLFKLGMVFLLWNCQTKTRLAISIYSAVVFNNILAGVLMLTA